MPTSSKEVCEAQNWNDKCNGTEFPVWPVCTFARRVKCLKYGSNKFTLPKYYLNWTDYISNFQVRADDIWVTTFPKCGTTWAQEMVWLIANDLDYERAKVSLHERFPYFELSAMWKDESNQDLNNNDAEGKENISSTARVKSTFNTLAAVDSMKSPRFIKSHLPYSLLPNQIEDVKPRIIYVARNSKDACVSYYHHSVLIDGYKGTMEDFTDSFINDEAIYTPFWKHIQEFHDLRQQSNILFLTFEEMKSDLRSVVERTAAFLNKSIDNKDMNKLLDHLSFESMKNNPYCNYEDVARAAVVTHQILDKNPPKSFFMRKGKVNGWKDEMTPDMIQKFDEWNFQNGVKGLFN